MSRIFPFFSHSQFERVFNVLAFTAIFLSLSVSYAKADHAYEMLNVASKRISQAQKAIAKGENDIAHIHLKNAAKFIIRAKNLEPDYPRTPEVQALYEKVASTIATPPPADLKHTSDEENDHHDDEKPHTD